MSKSVKTPFVSFTQYLIDYADKSSINLTQLADIMGVSRSVLYTWRSSGKGTLPYESVGFFCDYFGLSMEEVWERYCAGNGQVSVSSTPLREKVYELESEVSLLKDTIKALSSAINKGGKK